jgi:excisionase family DNA binding protein
MCEEIKVPTMLSIKETAKKTGVAEFYIRQLVAKNEICFVKAGKKYLINLEKFVEYLNTPQTA